MRLRHSEKSSVLKIYSLIYDYVFSCILFLVFFWGGGWVFFAIVIVVVVVIVIVVVFKMSSFESNQYFFR